MIVVRFGHGKRVVTQSQEVGDSDIGMIRGLLDEHPEWRRSRLSVELCECWDWRNAQGRIKDMAARALVPSPGDEDNRQTMHNAKIRPQLTQFGLGIPTSARS